MNIKNKLGAAFGGLALSASIAGATATPLETLETGLSTAGDSGMAIAAVAVSLFLLGTVISFARKGRKGGS